MQRDALKIRVRRQNEGVGAVFCHTRVQYLGEVLVGCVQVADHGVALPPSDQTDGVGVKPRKEKHHGPSRTHGAGADIGVNEANLWDGSADIGANGVSDLITVGDVILAIGKDCCKGGAAGGVVMEKLHHSEI